MADVVASKESVCWLEKRLVLVAQLRKLDISSSYMEYTAYMPVDLPFLQFEIGQHTTSKAFL